jgi:hypothetical protein
VNYVAVVRGINSLRTLFTPHIVVESNYNVTATEVSWNGYETGFVSDLLYADEHARLLQKRQYSLLLYDRSFIQFYYKFDDTGELTSGRLAYYPSPIQVHGEVLEEYLERLEMTGETLIDDYYQHLHEHFGQGGVITNSSHIRIDYDPSAEGHAICHLQLGSISQFRIGADVQMTPFTFWHWVVQQLLDADGIERFRSISDKRNYKDEFVYQSQAGQACEVQDAIYLTTH